MELEAAIDLFAGKMDEQTKATKSLHRFDPLWRNLGIGAVAIAATQTVILPQRPAAGRMWFVHRVGILGADGHTSVAGAIVDVYTGPGQEADATGEIYSGLTIPSIIVEGRYHNPVLPNEQVYCICYGLTVSQQLQFVVGVEEYPLPAHTGVVID